MSWWKSRVDLKDIIFSQPQCIGFHFYFSMVLLVILAVCFFAAEAGARPRPEKTRPTPVRMYTMDKCDRCEFIKQTLKHHGVHLAPEVEIREPHEAEYYPTIVYSDGSKDNGLKIERREVAWPQFPLPVYHFKGW